MKIKDKRLLDDYGTLDQVSVGEVIQFKTEREDGDILYWLKTDNEITSQCHCVNLEDGSLELFGLQRKCFIVNAQVAIEDFYQ